MNPRSKSLIATGVAVGGAFWVGLEIWAFWLIFLPGMTAGWYAREADDYFFPSSGRS